MFYNILLNVILIFEKKQSFEDTRAMIKALGFIDKIDRANFIFS